MKILLWSAGTVVLLLACIVVIGLLLPKQHVASRSAAYRAQPARLFALIAGPQDWRPEVKRSEMIPDATGRQLQRETVRNGQTIVYELLNAAPPTSIKRRVATANLPYSGTWTFSLEDQGASTVVRITENGEVYNPIFRFVSRFLLGHTGTLDAYLRALGQATGESIEIKD